MPQLADLAFLRTFTGGDPEKMKKYINLFLNGAAPGLDALRSNLAASDWSALRTSAHSLKSQVKYMGIKEAEDLAFFVEQHAGNGTELDKMPATVQKLCDVTNLACTELRDELTRL